jgi:hypothetical protein
MCEIHMGKSVEDFVQCPNTRVILTECGRQHSIDPHADIGRTSLPIGKRFQQQRFTTRSGGPAEFQHPGQTDVGTSYPGDKMLEVFAQQRPAARETNPFDTKSNEHTGNTLNFLESE